MAVEPLVAHSLVEICLFLLVTPCESCRKGPLRRTVPLPPPDATESLRLSLRSECACCRAPHAFVFDIPQPTTGGAATVPIVINPGAEPSLMIDLAQWLTLVETICHSAVTEQDRRQARYLKMDAAQCLHEALKFYEDADNDLPPPRALFHDASRRRFRDHPEEFSRQRLINTLSKLPNPTAGGVSSGEAGPVGVARWFCETSA